jgi:hypothetical protein
MNGGQPVRLFVDSDGGLAAFGAVLAVAVTALLIWFWP